MIVDLRKMEVTTEEAWNNEHRGHPGIPYATETVDYGLKVRCACGAALLVLNPEKIPPVPTAPADDRHTFASGASSSGQKPRYDLIPSYALRRMAIRFSEGAARYGDNNWQKGVKDRAFILDRINHTMEHLMNLKDRVAATADPNLIIPTPKDDDAAAVCLNAIFVMGWEENL